MHILKKNYIEWIKQKVKINNEYRRPQKYFEGGIYWTYLGQNIGFEQDGQGKTFSRPALIIAKYNDEFALCLPISHTIKRNSYYYPINIGKISGSIILSQSRSIDTLRLGRYIASIPYSMLNDVRVSVAKIILRQPLK